MGAKYVKAFNADQGELSLNLSNKDDWKRYQADRIKKIEVNTIEKKSLFGKKQVNRIAVYINGEEEPYVIQKGSYKEDYAWAQEILKKFSEKNKVPFVS